MLDQLLKVLSAGELLPLALVDHSQRALFTQQELHPLVFLWVLLWLHALRSAVLRSSSLRW